MEEVSQDGLPEPTGDRWVDRIVEGVTGLFELIFPDRIRGYYLRGSRASGTSIAGSDIDMFVVFKDGYVERAEGRRAYQVAGYCARLSATPLEIIVVSEHQLQREDNLVVALQLKLSSRLLHGQDIREDLPDIQTDAYVRAAVHAPYHSYRYPAQRRNDPALTYPVRHLDPTGPFFGFDQWLLPGPDGAEEPSTKLLVASVGWTATAIIAMRTGRYVGDKRTCVELYKAHIADEWTELVVSVHDVCRNRWHYRIPATEDERRALRAMCEQALAFQNHYLSQYRRFLLAELRSGAPDRQLLATRRLAEIVFPDPEVVEVLSELRTSDRSDLRDAVTATLDRYDRGER